MSAIGDYIFLTYRDYAFGADLHHPVEHYGVALKYAQKSIDAKQKEIKRRANLVGNKRESKRLEKVLNQSLEQMKIIDSSVDGMNQNNFKQRLEAAFNKKSKKYENYKIESNLGLSLKKHEEDMIERIAKYAELKDKTEDMLDELVIAINKHNDELLQQKAIESYTKKMIEDEQNRIKKIIENILKFSKLRDEDDIGKEELKEVLNIAKELQQWFTLDTVPKRAYGKSMSTPAKIIKKLYNSFARIPNIAIGDLGEVFVQVALLGSGYYSSVEITGNQSSLPVLITSLFSQNSIIQTSLKEISAKKTSFMSDELRNSLNNYDKKYGNYLAAASDYTQDVVDIVAKTTKGKDLKISVKNISSDNGANIHILSGMNLNILTQNENNYNFITHYINTMVPHYSKLFRNKREIGENGFIYEHGMGQFSDRSAKTKIDKNYIKMKDTMNNLLLLKAFTRDNLLKLIEETHRVDFVPTADYFAINIREGNEAKWHVWTMSEIYGMIQQEQAFTYEYHKTGDNKDINPFPKTRFYQAKPPYSHTLAKEEINNRLRTIFNKYSNRKISMIIHLTKLLRLDKV